MKKTILSFFLLGSTCVLFAQDVRNGDSSYNRNNSNNYNNTNSSYNNDSTTNNSMRSNSSYSAYSNVPINVRSSFQRDYPSANNVNWQQSSEWWHVTYMNNGQSMNTYYNTAGQTFNVALPVIETQVPADVVSKVTNTYGPGVYDITRVKGMDNQDEYIVRILDNGQMRTERINGDGMKVTESSTNPNAMDSIFSEDFRPNTSTNTTDTNTSTNDSTIVTTDNSTNANTTESSDVNANQAKTGKDKWKVKTVTPEGKKHIMKMKNGKMRDKTIDMNKNQDQNQ